MADGGNGLVQIAFLHSDQVSYSWVDSMRRLIKHDTEGPRRLAKGGEPLNIRCSTGQLVPSRNYAVQLFLDKTDAEWLFFLDTDMGFTPTTIDELLAVADPAKTPVVGALCFAQCFQGYDGMGGMRVQIVPTLYRIGREKQTGHASFSYFGAYPPDSVVRVAATGMACILIHRSVLEKVRAEHGDCWFDQVRADSGNVVGEDFSFCLRLNQAGVPVHVHTGVPTTHHKQVWLGEDDYIDQQVAQQQPVELLPRPGIPVHVDVAASAATLGAEENEQNIDGIRMWKLPADLDRYAAIIAATRPDVVVETGTKWGGSALWFAQQGLDVVTVDIDDSPAAAARQRSDRVTWISGSSIDPEVVAAVAAAVDGRRVMVSLDSEHSAPHVAEEIAAYGPLVSPGCYLVVEDGIFDLVDTYAEQARGGHLIPHLGGPLKAIEETLANDPGWERDVEVEKMHPTSHHVAGWWLRREAAADG